MKKLRMVKFLVDRGDGQPGMSLDIPAESVFGLFRPSGTPKVYTMNGREVIEFGSTGFFGSLLVDVSSGSILERVQDATNLSMVNTSLSAFNNCLEMFSEYFPLDQIDDEDASIERNARVAREIESDVKRIDPEAYEEGSFWYEVRWSVAIGDFED